MPRVAQQLSSNERSHVHAIDSKHRPGIAKDTSMTNSTRVPVHWLSLVLIGCFFASTAIIANDWPQWRGADRLATWTEDGIVDELPNELKITWRVPVRSGYSGPAVADGRVFVTDWEEDPESRTVDGTERLVVLDEQTGELLWTHEWSTSYRMLMFSYAVGPRATPTVDGNRVYVVGAAGRLLCLNVETGTFSGRRTTSRTMEPVCLPGASRARHWSTATA